MKKLLTWATSHGKVVIISLCFSLLALWSLDRRLPVTQIENVAVTNVTHPGKTVKMRHTVFRTMSCPSVRDRILMDGGNVRTYLGEDSWNAAPGPLGVNDTFFDKVLIPADAVPGHAYVIYNIAWTCNAVQSILNMPVTTSFRVDFEIKR